MSEERHGDPRVLLFLFVILIVAIQFIPVDRSNYAGTSEVDAPEAVLQVLQRSCYDCHSGATRWPWYSYVAPVSWVVSHDVHEARKHLDFSKWGEDDERQRKLMRQEIWKEVNNDGMPMKAYLFLHGSAKLSADEKDVIRRWSRGRERRGD